MLPNRSLIGLTLSRSVWMLWRISGGQRRTTDEHVPQLLPQTTQVRHASLNSDVFEDLELSNLETFERKIKIEVWSQLVDHIAHGNYTRAELAQILHIYQPDVSNLLHAKFSKFSTDTLIRYADELNNTHRR